jgi:hypothetical protein
MTVKRRPKDGADGDGIVSVIIEYAKSTNGTTPPDTGWSTAIPSPTQGWYMWTRTTTTYKQSPTTVAYSVSRWPADGLPGIQGPVVIQKEWVQGDTHRYTDEIKDYIYVRGATKAQSYWYTLINKGTVTAGAQPVGGVAPSGYESVTWLRDLAVQFLIAEEANLANLIFKQGQLISVRGTVNGLAADYAGQANFIPNIVIDGANGSISSESSNIRGTIHATDGEFTGVINAIGGRIAGFRISGNSLTNQNSNGSFITDAAIIFRNDNLGTFVAIGGNVLPVITGSVAVARFENNIVYDPLFPIPNYGIIAQAKNGPMFENHAIAILGGMISGFAIKVRQIDSSTTLEYYDVYVSCYNTSSINLYLPANPSVGKVIIAQRVNEASITFYGNGKIIRWGIGQGSSKITTGSIGDSHIFIFDGQFWHYNYWVRQPS